MKIQELYQNFLGLTVERYSAVALSEVSEAEVSHDMVTRWLAESRCSPREIWKANKDSILGKGGVIIADDTVIQKSYSKKIELVRWQYSGAEHDIVKGIGMLNMLFVDNTGEQYPMDLRIWEPKEDKKTKNDLFREMLQAAKERGVTPEVVIADCWYGSLENVKYIRSLGWNWIMGLKKNRAVNRNEKLEDLNIPEEGLKVHLRGYGWIYVFRLVEKNGYTRYFGTNLENPTIEQIIKYVKMRWNIEVFHRELKQCCGLEKCQARTGRSQRNHIVLSVLTWINQRKLRALYGSSIYKLKWNVVKYAIKNHLSIKLNLAT